MALISLLAVTACGSGGGGGMGFLPSSSSSNQKTASSNQKTAATVKLVTTATGTTIYGVDATVNLAAGVTVRSSNPPIVDDGVVTSSSGTVAMALYTAASGTYPGTVNVWVLNEAGFGVGEVCTINANIAAGHSPAAADFSIASFLASDAIGSAIGTAAPDLMVNIH